MNPHLHVASLWVIGGFGESFSSEREAGTSDPLNCQVGKEAVPVAVLFRCPAPSDRLILASGGANGHLPGQAQTVSSRGKGRP